MVSLDDLSALRDRVIEVVGQFRADSRALHDRLCEILVAQDYQDLIGQVIQTVVQLLQEVEAKLATMASCRAASRSRARRGTMPSRNGRTRSLQRGLAS